MFFAVLCMLFGHVLADYPLQGILASMKQKSWWEANSPDPMYRHDYIVALIMHSLCWTFLVMLPPAACVRFHVSAAFLVIFLLNVAIHSFVDDLKANRKKLNLWGDQLIHIAQILVTAFLLFGPLE